MKPGNEPREVWRHGEGARRPLALLYLHGFSASPGEAGHLPERMAEQLDANLYVHRWPGHGEFAPDAMRGLTCDRLENSAVDALDRARRMGDMVAVIGSSLGATLGLWLAAERPADVAAVVAWSPGIQAADPALLDQFCGMDEPWMQGSGRSHAVRAFWSDAIHPDGFNALRETFRRNALRAPWPRVRCPVFLGYYRDSAGNEDQTASVPAMLTMFDALGTPSEHKHRQAFAAGAHAIGSPYRTGAASAVADASVEFLRAVLPAHAQASAG